VTKRTRIIIVACFSVSEIHFVASDVFSRERMADNINLFKNHLDKFWSSCDFVYSYRAQPFGIGSAK